MMVMMRFDEILPVDGINTTSYTISPRCKTDISSLMQSYRPVWCLKVSFCGVNYNLKLFYLIIEGGLDGTLNLNRFNPNFHNSKPRGHVNNVNLDLISFIHFQ